MLVPRKMDLPTPSENKKGWPWTYELSDNKFFPVDDHHTSWPKISIVTPSFNQAQFLEETIRSVIMQGYPNLEYIIIDGGSTDGSVEIIKKYERWISYWVSEPDYGQSEAINKGISHCTGDFFAWINSDDMYISDSFIKLVEASRKHPGGILYYGDCEIIDENRTPIQCLRGMPFDLNELLLVTNDHHNITQPACFFSTIAINEIGGVNENLHMIMDIDLYLRLASRFGVSDIYYLPEIWSCFRRHSTQKTYDINPAFQKERLTVIKNLYQISSNSNLFNDRVIRRRAFAWAYWTYAYGLIKQSDRLNGLYYLSKAILLDSNILTRRKFRNRLREIAQLIFNFRVKTHHA